MSETASFAGRMRRREPLVGTLLSLPSPELAEICAGAGFDWLFVDMEHGLFDFTAVQRVIQAAGERCPCLVRIPELTCSAIQKALDTGAAGLIVPHVNSAAEASRAAVWAKYPPAGGRSIGFTRANRYGARFEGHLIRANDETLLVVQVEHIEGVRAIDGILEAAGVDAVFIGPYDLSASLNRPGELAHPEVAAAIDCVRRACDARETPRGIFVRNAAAGRTALEDGFSLLACGLDVALFSHAAATLRNDLRKGT